MRLLITTPLEVVADDDDVAAARAEDDSGGFGILAGHADFLTCLPISIVGWRHADGGRRYCAVRRGVLTVRGGQRGRHRHPRGRPRRRSGGARGRARAASAPSSRPSARSASNRTRLQLTGDPADRAVICGPTRRDAGGTSHDARQPRSHRTTTPLSPSVAALRGATRRGCRDGEPSLARHLAQIGVLGWIVVTPMLLGVFLGRWLDRQLRHRHLLDRAASDARRALGCWSAWRWVHADGRAMTDGRSLGSRLRAGSAFAVGVAHFVACCALFDLPRPPDGPSRGRAAGRLRLALRRPARRRRAAGRRPLLLAAGWLPPPGRSCCPPRAPVAHRRAP